MEQYAKKKPAIFRDAINALCQTPFSQHTGRHAAYQAPQRSSLHAGMVMAIVRRAWHATHAPLQLELTDAAELQLTLKCVQYLAHLAAAQRVNNVRVSHYKARVGSWVTILTAPGGVEAGECSRALGFDQALQRARSGSASASRGLQQTLDTSFTRERFLFLPGDIVFTEAGVDEAEDSLEQVDTTEGWWALQLTQPFERARINVARRPAACKLHGFWLARKRRSRALEWVLLTSHEDSVCYGTVLKDAQGRPAEMISSAELQSSYTASAGSAGNHTWAAGARIYTFSAELVERLDQLAEEVVDAATGVVQENDAEGGSEEGEESDDEPAVPTDGEIADRCAYR